MGPIEAFHKKHDPSGPCIIENCRVYWPNGAWRENSAYGCLADPSPNERERLKMIVYYWQVRLSRAVEAFHDLKRDLQLRAKFAARGDGFPPSEEKIAELRTLRSESQACRTELDKAEAELAKTAPGETRLREEAKAARMKQGQEFLSELNKVEV